MIQLGITGGIGSGKTTVCEVLKHFAIPVYHADDEAKIILDSAAIQKKVRKAFGKIVVDEAGKLDRKKIAALVFSDQTKLEILNSIIHPELAKHYHQWLKSKSKHPIVAMEAAILFESGSFSQMDKIITVYAPREIRIQRAMQRSNATRSEILDRIKKQMPEKEKIKRADFVIDNDGKKLVIPQVLKVLEQLKKT